MAQTSDIEWTDADWNPITGYTKVGPGCDNCYAERFAAWCYSKHQEML